MLPTYRWDRRWSASALAGRAWSWVPVNSSIVSRDPAGTVRRPSGGRACRGRGRAWSGPCPPGRSWPRPPPRSRARTRRTGPGPPPVMGSATEMPGAKVTAVAPSCLTRAARPSAQRREFSQVGKEKARRAGFEPATRCLEGSRSIRLSYRRMMTIVHGKGHASATRRSQSARRRQRSIYPTPGWLRSVTRPIRHVPDSLAAATAPR
jgi:hypothetical protein